MVMEVRSLKVVIQLMSQVEFLFLFFVLLFLAFFPHGMCKFQLKQLKSQSISCGPM